VEENNVLARLKAVFPMVFISLEMLAMGHALFALSHGISWSWTAVLVSSGATLGLFAQLMAKRTARTSPVLPVHLTLGGLASVLALTEAARGGSWVPAVYAVGLGVLGQLLYVFWYSRLGRPMSKLLQIGVSLPSFHVHDETGARIASASLLGTPVVWLFYRGNWCPLCMAQIKEVAACYRDLEARGAVVALVSPQSQEHTRALAARFEAPMRFFVDPGRAAARVLGIEHEKGVPTGMEVLGYESDTVFPTVIITDATGVIVFCDQTDNYRVRPEPELFRRILGHAPGSQSHHQGGPPLARELPP
jgi:peroxiredoxin